MWKVESREVAFTLIIFKLTCHIYGLALLFINILGVRF